MYKYKLQAAFFEADYKKSSYKQQQANYFL